jgi:hypothetical protein
VLLTFASLEVVLAKGVLLRLCGVSLCRESGLVANVLLGLVGETEQGQGGFPTGSVCRRPAILGLDEDGAGEAQQRRRIGKTPTTSVRAFDLFIEPF